MVNVDLLRGMDNNWSHVFSEVHCQRRLSRLPLWERVTGGKILSWKFMIVWFNSWINKEIKEEKRAWTNDEYHGVSETGVLIKPICNSEVRYEETRSYFLCGKGAHGTLCLGCLVLSDAPYFIIKLTHKLKKSVSMKKKRTSFTRVIKECNVTWSSSIKIWLKLWFLTN